MILQGDSDIIQRCEWLPEGQMQHLLFRNGSVLVISSEALAYYKSVEAISDPLGNGLVELVELTSALQCGENGFVTEYHAGFVGLTNDRVLLITPNDIQLFTDKNDALRNQNEIARLQLG